MISRPARTRIALGVGGIVIVSGVLGCMHMRSQQYPASGPTFSVTLTSNPAPVTAADFGHTWTLNVDRGTIGCTKDADGDPTLFFTAPDGTEYALNGVTGNKDRPDIEDIANGSVGPLRSFAFGVCDVP